MITRICHFGALQPSRSILRQAGRAERAAQVLEIGRVAVLDVAAQIGLPGREVAAGEARHLVLGDIEELRQRRLRLCGASRRLPDWPPATAALRCAGCARAAR